jgi:hypothetical protein
MSDIHESRMLLALLQERWGELDRLDDERPPDPERFVGLCVQCDVPTWVLSRIERAERSARLGREILERLSAQRSRVRRDNQHLLARAEQSLDVLREAGVVPIVLKGLDLLHRIYERFDDRTLNDVDLLIAPDELERAIRALERAGWVLPSARETRHYLRSSHHLPIRSPGSPPVDFEIHWNLAQELRFRVDGDGLRRRALPLTVAGRAVRRLDDHDFVAHLLLHHFTHYFDRTLKWAVDMHLTSAAPGFDWTAVARRVREWGATAAAGMAVVHLAKVLPDWLPETIRGELRVSPWRRALTRPLLADHPLDLFRRVQDRRVRLYLAAVLLERPALLPRWLVRRALRDRRPGALEWDNDPPLTRRPPAPEGRQRSAGDRPRSA